MRNTKSVEQHVNLLAKILTLKSALCNALLDASAKKDFSAMTRESVLLNAVEKENVERMKSVRSAELRASVHALILVLCAPNNVS
ncbi:hypothetical protein OESDEN_13163 [Oesophagostomum dentatum]|uniref:Uncharacterized protein n=1 Tax=Oesophagostomum dentatum TaxID=61180 RepID=A0A0B1ST58_OESDE|nr:hypothetical protein OESDEN_13163 [Oesophagostomum dentatum]